MQTVLEGKLGGTITTATLGYQYDTRDRELFLESGYKYKVCSVLSNGELIIDEIDLEDNDAI